MNLTNEINALEAIIKVLQTPLEKGSIDYYTTYDCIVNSITAIDNVVKSLKSKKK